MFLRKKNVLVHKKMNYHLLMEEKYAILTPTPHPLNSSFI